MLKAAKQPKPTPSRTVHELAEVLGVPTSMPLVHDRHLAKAGLRSKEGRGLGVARMTARDATHLLVAVIGSRALDDSVSTVERYAATRPVGGEDRAPYAGIGIAELESLPARHSLVDAIEMLIVSAAGGALAGEIAAETRGTAATPEMVAPMMEISLLATGTLGEVRIAGAKGGRTAAVRYAIPFPAARKGGKRPSGRELDAWAEAARASRGEGDFERSGRVTERTILRLAAMLAPATKEGV